MTSKRQIAMNGRAVIGSASGAQLLTQFRLASSYHIYWVLFIHHFSTSSVMSLIFFKILFIYSRETQREREREAETQAEREAGSLHREPDVGFDPGSPGSRPGPKAGAKPLRHPGIPASAFKISNA